MDSTKLTKDVEQSWQQTIIPTLMDYIRIPNVSPDFDAKWQQHGHMDAAVTLLAGWAKKQQIQGLQLEVVQLEERTPVIFIEVPGASDKTVLLYGHLDKQPEMHGWDEDLGPWQPVIKDDKLYGRGGADDGYSLFCALSAIKAAQQQGAKLPRCVIIIEACEESGSYDLPYYVENLQSRIGEPELIICLDSGAGDYQRLWCTTSLRGMVLGELQVNVLTEGVHSGMASGIVPSSFRIIRQLLSRIEDETSGEILLPELKVTIPDDRIKQAEDTANFLGDEISKSLPFVEGMSPVNTSNTELLLNRTWRAALSITGADGLPPNAKAGNVLRPQTTVKLSMRIPPTCDPKLAASAMKAKLEANSLYGAKVNWLPALLSLLMLEANSLYGAKVNFTPMVAQPGWNAPATDEKLAQIINQASEIYYQNPAAYFGEGGTIPFMGMLGERFPQAQFMIVGVLGPHSNAHGPNEFLHIPMAKKLTCCVAEVLSRI